MSSRPFTPPPEPERCCAVLVMRATAFRARCWGKRMSGYDLCRDCRESEVLGIRVSRVKAGSK